MWNTIFFTIIRRSIFLCLLYHESSFRTVLLPETRKTGKSKTLGKILNVQ